MARRMVILTEGHSNPHTAKTGCSIIRYQREEVVAVLDSTEAGKTAAALFGVGDDLPVVARLADAPDADTLVIGIAPPGGNIPATWRAAVLEAIDRGMTIVSGLHDFLSDDAEFADAAQRSGATLQDVRKTSFRKIARREGLRDDCFRVYTIGHDCSIGKMVAAIEVTRSLQRRGFSAKFIATGQTGIMIEGDGLPMDAIVSDFVSGAAESLVLEHQDREFVVVEGQGSLVHPSYSAVTLGILHGVFPHAMVLCFEVGRTEVTGLEPLAIPPLTDIRRLAEAMAGIWRPCPVVAIAMNSRRVDAEQAEQVRQQIEQEMGLPVADVFRHGPDTIVDAIVQSRDAFHAG